MRTARYERFKTVSVGSAGPNRLLGYPPGPALIDLFEVATALACFLAPPVVVDHGHAGNPGRRVRPEFCQLWIEVLLGRFNRKPVRWIGVQERSMHLLIGIEVDEFVSVLDVRRSLGNAPVRDLG